MSGTFGLSRKKESKDKGNCKNRLCMAGRAGSANWTTACIRKNKNEYKIEKQMEIQKVGDISHNEFMNRFYNPGIPVVFKSASKAWKASNLFTPDYFRHHFGERQTMVNEQTLQYPRNMYNGLTTALLKIPPLIPLNLIFRISFRN